MDFLERTCEIISHLAAITPLLLSRSDLDLTDSNALVGFCQRHKPDLLLHVAVSLSDLTNNLLMYYALEACSPFLGK